LPQKYSPIRPSTGDGNQGAYLAEISQEVFDIIVDSSVVNSELLVRGGANSLTYQVIKEQLNDRAERVVHADTNLDQTTKEAVIQARRGQGKFRTNVESIEKECRVTGVRTPSLLIASHIMPWRSCTTAGQRLDGMNGLMLTPDADLLFDRGFMTFEDDGSIKYSQRVNRDDLRRLGLGDVVWHQLRGFGEAPMTRPSTSFKPAQCEYLVYHRTEVYLN
jgi:hypothetical protein